jgi:hypothetical protein
MASHSFFQPKVRWNGAHHLRLGAGEVRQAEVENLVGYLVQPGAENPAKTNASFIVTRQTAQVGWR